MPNTDNLQTLANVGPAVGRRLEGIGITSVEQLRGRDPLELFETMCVATGRAEDPCLLDTLMSAVDQAGGAPGKPWWHYTSERKRLLATSREESAAVATDRTRPEPDSTDDGRAETSFIADDSEQ
ncbi:helix-hairpin-helix domain-containing protein [Streptosporangium subroseum]|nr:helix-hairpin-helix domain-containing protein [Streptosporangium subroseum]